MQSESSSAEQMLGCLFAKHFGVEAQSITMLPPSGSNRKYYRIAGGGHSAIGVFNTDHKENAAFLSFSKSLRQRGVRVPEVYAADEAYGIYLQQDLGDTTLFALLTDERKANEGSFTPHLVDLYKRVLADLASIQSVGRESIDFSKCYPRAAFDRQSMTWDLQYFKYYFLKLAHIGFDEQTLEDDFGTLMDYLETTQTDFFLYRDFQSRNIMICNDQPWYIDYQGGRRGAREYDVASLLYDAKADIPQTVREELMESYVAQLPEADRAVFESHFYAYVMIRIMQAMGAYGYRGFFEQKAHFLRSIPFAVANLRYILASHFPPLALPELRKALEAVCESEELKRMSRVTRLKVSVCSFSYKHGIPVDNSGNGGGFVFDCRALPNPGRYEQYKKLTGRDEAVVQYFADYAEEMNTFLTAAQTMLRKSIERYIERGFTSLTVSFGCTGGQHRSVFCADQTARWIRDNFDCDVDLRHWEQKHLGGL